MELWKTNKPRYVSKTLAKQKLKKCGTAKEIGQVHTYLENRGYINFGCGKLFYIKLRVFFMIVLFMTKLIFFSYFDRYLQNMTLKVIQFIYFSAECKYHKNVKKELIQARMLKTQYNLKPPLLHGNHRTLKKVSISFPFYFYKHKQKILNFA